MGGGGERQEPGLDVLMCCVPPPAASPPWPATSQLPLIEGPLKGHATCTANPAHNFPGTSNQRHRAGRLDHGKFCTASQTKQ